MRDIGETDGPRRSGRGPLMPGRSGTTRGTADRQKLRAALRAEGYSAPEHRPLFGIHVFSEAGGGVMRCRCGAEYREWLSIGGERWRTGILRACTYRPTMRWSISRDEQGLPQRMYWQGYW